VEGFGFALAPIVGVWVSCRSALAMFTLATSELALRRISCEPACRPRGLSPMKTANLGSGFACGESKQRKSSQRHAATFATFRLLKAHRAIDGIAK
jgi:hypothetical protein